MDWRGGGAGSPTCSFQPHPSSLFPHCFYLLLCCPVSLDFFSSQRGLFYRGGLDAQRGKVIFRVTLWACVGGVRHKNHGLYTQSGSLIEVTSAHSTNLVQSASQRGCCLPAEVAPLDQCWTGGFALPALSSDLRPPAHPACPILVPA